MGVERVTEQQLRENHPISIGIIGGKEVKVRLVSIGMCGTWCERVNRETLALARKANRAAAALSSADAAAISSKPETIAAADAAYEAHLEAQSAYYASANEMLAEYLALAQCDVLVESMTAAQAIAAFETLFQLSDPTAVSQLSRLRDLEGMQGRLETIEKTANR